jgi:hypothetical protein
MDSGLRRNDGEKGGPAPSELALLVHYKSHVGWAEPAKPNSNDAEMLGFLRQPNLQLF